MRLIRGDKPPVVSRPYRYDRVKQNILDYHIEKMLKEEPIIPIQSPYTSPVVLCRKNNGLPLDNPKEYRFAVDYIKLNAITWHKKTVVYRPQANRTEHENRDLVQMIVKEGKEGKGRKKTLAYKRSFKSWSGGPERKNRRGTGHKPMRRGCNKEDQFDPEEAERNNSTAPTPRSNEGQAAGIPEAEEVSNNIAFREQGKRPVTNPTHLKS
ncbi:retrovirus-related Pol polyprotein from transposon 297 [Trichonephila clavipes]|uniref:Retrovirus-related Pol polyprotein from transposon 297 n=1 Tax=Trichonephila clavipes TaxID=2585209 RepID=A0A8X7BF21_TRICX|nr:retrovirus-related Pol polyprotein from transposon 297 [Trichonephila clavipes]